MNREILQQSLNHLPIGPVRYFDRIGSTNDEAARWAREGAPDLALVVADEQTAGRGRSVPGETGRRWYTPPGAALAFTVVLRPPSIKSLHRYSALGALAVCGALEDCFELAAQIKWPNDVLVRGKKVCGVLEEGQVLGNDLEVLLLGIGINITPEAVPPPERLNFPATCVEEEVGKLVDRHEFLAACLERMLGWRDRLESEAFMQAWENNLAWKGEQVALTIKKSKPPVQGRLLGLTSEGALQIMDGQDQVISFLVGEVSLRQAETPPRLSTHLP